MAIEVQLSEAEKTRLERILSQKELAPQKRVAYPFWIIAGITFVASQVALFLQPSLGFALLAMSFAILMIGIARHGYYQLFRLLHYQNDIIQRLQCQLTTDNSGT
jgi:uncharacterized membrane protein